MTKCNLPTASVPTCKRRKLEAHSGGGRYRATEACCCCGPPRRRSSAGSDRRGGGGPGDERHVVSCEHRDDRSIHRLALS